MTTKQKLERVKINLTLEKEFYDLLLFEAAQDYMKVATWTKQLLMKSLLGNNKDSNTLTKNEHGI